MAVPAAITAPLLRDTLRILDTDLREKFGITKPRIAVLDLNPHAGEGGHMGHEEIDTIIPVLEELRGQGLDLAGPLPADLNQSATAQAADLPTTMDVTAQ